MDFQPSSSDPEVASKELSEKLIAISQDYINHFNNRDFAALRSMRYLFAEGFTSDVQPSQHAKGWDDYIDMLEAVWAADLSIKQKEAQAEVDIPNGRADVVELVEHHDRSTGITIQTTRRVVWRREWFEGKWLATSFVMFKNAGLGE